MSNSSEKTRKNPSPGKRRTIAFFSERYLMPGSYYSLQWDGVSDRTEELDINLLTVVGGVLGTHPAENRTLCRSRIYNLISPENVDGIIVAGGIVVYSTMDTIRTFFKGYRPLPLVGIAETLPEVPSVLVENKNGMREIFVHLIRDHGYRKIAFIRGPGEFGDAFIRYQVYQEMLAEYGLPFDPDLVTTGDFIDLSGARAVKTLLDERRVSFDAIVASNDNMAHGAMKELQRRGIRVPEEVAVAGYDNTDEAKMTKPPLTTVNQPIYEQGRHAVDLLMKMISGEKRPDNIILPTRMVIGQSCGCVLPAVLNTRKEKNHVCPPGPDSLAEKLESLRRVTVSEMIEAIRTYTDNAAIPADQVEKWMTGFYTDFVKDLNEYSAKKENPCSDHGPKLEKLSCFPAALSELLYTVGEVGGETMLWHDVISALRRNLLAALSGSELADYAERLWGQARIILSKRIEQIEVFQRYEAGREISNMLSVNEALSSTFDIALIIDLLAERIGDLFIPSCYLAAYTDSDFEKGVCRLHLAYSDRNRITTGEKSADYRASQILPSRIWPKRRFHLMLNSLHFQNTPLGILLLEVGPRNGDTYETLRSQISNALQGAYLVQQVSERARALETANEEIRQLNFKLKDENLHMRAEMKLARRIQTALLPAGVKKIHRDFDIAAIMLPAEQVGGDYYDITLDQSGVLWFGIGDVSGHGLTPGLIMMMAQTVHTAITTNFNASPRDIVIMINKALYKNVQIRLHEDHFMTFTTLKYLGEGRFQFAGAHVDLIVYRKQTGHCELIETAGLFLNFIPNIEKVTLNLELTLETGDVLILYTDGLTEARNKKRELLDLTGLMESVEKHVKKSVEKMRDGIMNDVLSWSGGRQDDDMSLVVIRRIN